MNGTVHQLTGQVVFQAIVRIEVQGLLSELGEEAELVDRTFTLQTGETDTVHTTTVFSQHRQLGGDVAHVLGRTVQVAIGDGCTGGVDTLVVDVAVIQQGNVLEDLDGLAVVLRHVGDAGERHEILLFARFDDRLLQPEEGVHLVGTSTVDGRLLPVDGGVVVQHVVLPQRRP